MHKNKRITIGLPSCRNAVDRRFPLTPEAVAVLVERGYKVCVEKCAAATIHYSDAAYIRSGAAIVDRATALGCDIVIHLATLDTSDVRNMRRGATLLSLLHAQQQKPETISLLLDRAITAVAVDLILNQSGNTPFADILSEVDGRASIALASSLLADSEQGKGILLGGVAGVVACEVVILGSGIAARAAASSALGLGATVRIFDNDTYRLREAVAQLPAGVISSALHPKVLSHALREADVVVATDMSPACVVNADAVAEMKRGVVIIDLNHDEAPTFPSIEAIDISTTRDAEVASRRVCYTCAGNAVPRTASMALSNAFITLFDDMSVWETSDKLANVCQGVKQAIYTFKGKAVNDRIAEVVGRRRFDIDLFLTMS